MKEDIEKAVTVLNQGGIIIFPTDTAFGIGCRIDKEESIKRLFALRKRSETKSVPVLVNSLEMARKYVEEIPQEVEDTLINTFWPGGLTIVLQSRVQNVPVLVRGGGKTIGVRMPDNKTVLDVIAGIGVPLLGPSANFSGGKTPYTLEDLDPELVKPVDYVIPGVTSGANRASTVVDCTKVPWKILRQGVVLINQ